MMKKACVALWLGFAALVAANPAHAANVNIDGLPAASSAAGADLLECEQAGTNRKCTASQITAILLSAANTYSATQTLSGLTLSGITGSAQCLHVSSAGVVTGTGSDCGSGGGAVSSVAGGCGVAVAPTTGAVVASASVTARNNTATTDTLLGGDCGTVVTENNASSVAVGIARAGTTGFASGYYATVKNKGAGLVTITPTTSTIDGASSIALTQNQSVDFYSDGTNYITLSGRATGGTANTIASGTAALGTSAIASAACASVVTVAATGVLTTDAPAASFNGDPTAVTGYIPSTSGMLTIFAYPTSGNVNFKVCNNTTASITPGAITLNWRVVR